MNFDISQLPKQIHHSRSNKQLITEAQGFLNATSDTFCQAYFDNLGGVDNVGWQAMVDGMEATVTIVGATTSASGVGAGALSGYAGMAAAVSQMGLGGVTTTIAGLMGSNVVGAAATSVVTAAVGGPIVMGALIIGGTGLATFGTYELSKFTVEQAGALAAKVCLSQSKTMNPMAKIVNRVTHTVKKLY